MKSLITTDIKTILDKAIQSELYASHLYKHLANQLQRMGYFGAQKFFLAESATELEHYQQHVDYQNDVGSVAKVPAVEAMNESVGSLMDALEIGYETEAQLYEDYVRWYQMAAKDPVTQQFLLQFLEIQRKSVGEYADLLARLATVGDDKCGILIVDQEMGK